MHELTGAVVAYVALKEVAHGMVCLSESHRGLNFRDVISARRYWETGFTNCSNLLDGKNYVLSNLETVDEKLQGLADEVKSRAICQLEENFELNQFPIGQDVVLLPVNYMVHETVQITF